VTLVTPPATIAETFRDIAEFGKERFTTLALGPSPSRRLTTTGPSLSRSSAGEGLFALSAYLPLYRAWAGEGGARRSRTRAMGG